MRIIHADCKKMESLQKSLVLLNAFFKCKQQINLTFFLLSY